MITNISRFLHRHATPGRMLALLVLNVLMFAIFLPLMYRFFPSAKSMVSMDAPFFCDSEQIHTILTVWGEKRRSLQFWFHLIWDTVLPAAYALLFGFTISWLTARGFPPGSRWQKANALVLGAVFDLLENVGIMILIVGYPDKMPVIAWFKMVFTLLKYTTLIILILIIFIALIAAWRNRFRVLIESSDTTAATKSLVEKQLKD